MKCSRKGPRFAEVDSFVLKFANSTWFHAQFDQKRNSFDHQSTNWGRHLLRGEIRDTDGGTKRN